MLIVLGSLNEVNAACVMPNSCSDSPGCVAEIGKCGGEFYSIGRLAGGGYATTKTYPSAYDPTRCTNGVLSRLYYTPAPPNHQLKFSCCYGDAYISEVTSEGISTVPYKSVTGYENGISRMDYRYPKNDIIFCGKDAYLFGSKANPDLIWKSVQGQLGFCLIGKGDINSFKCCSGEGEWKYNGFYYKSNCGSYEANSISNTRTCTTSTSCYNTNCAPSGSCSRSLGCSDMCSNGDKFCATTSSYKLCGYYDTDPCLEWGSPVNCSNGLTCVNGNCQNAPINGQCDTTYLNCLSGDPINGQIIQGGSSWTCESINGGDNDSCIVCNECYVESGDSCIVDSCASCGTGDMICSDLGVCQEPIEVCDAPLLNIYNDEDCDGTTDYDNQDGKPADQDCMFGVKNIRITGGFAP